MEIGGEIMSTASLNWGFIGMSVLLGFLCLIYQQLIRTVPPSIFPNLGSKASESDSAWSVLRPRNVGQGLPNVSQVTYSKSKHPELKRITTQSV